MAIDCTECIAFHNEARMSCPCDGDESKCPLADEDDADLCGMEKETD